MGSVPLVWKEERLVESFDVDVLGRLRPQTMFAFLLNAAWNHANQSAYGYRQLSDRNLLWVLIKAQIRVQRLPKWGEHILIETWGKQTVRLYALRDFAVTSESGQKLISATSSWMILDRSSGWPRRFNQKSDGFPWLSGRDEMETNLDKVPELKKGTRTAGFPVRFSDIDVNRHVNSTKYLEWMMDSHSQDHLETNELTSLEMSFLSEATAHDEVVVYSEESSGQDLRCVRRASDEKELCRGLFAWRAVSQHEKDSKFTA